MTNDRLGLVRLAHLTVTKVRLREARKRLGHWATALGPTTGTGQSGAAWGVGCTAAAIMFH
ncbi:hypothetical protein [Streptomyces sp. NPDC051677]|uniref:hypothetical protein n=1 Tax=Streptomyces sp. NPDC051677 TaxID=3365669 RepID=UPI0037D8886D